MTKLNIFFITVASLGHSTHAREQYLRSVQSETQPASSTSNEDRSIMWPTYSPTVSHAPTTSAAPSMCIGNTVDWVDIDGDGCDWYEAVDLPGCPYWGDWASNMGVANDNCCYCAGTGAPITYSPTSLRPTYSPTVSHAPTTSAAPSMCIGNTVDWVDIDGDGCDWYEANDLPGCPYWGDWASNMGVANDNCCYCAGTGAPITYSPTSLRPTYSPTVSHAPTTSAAPSMCIGNTVDWVDIDGDGCNWYEANDLPGCPYWGDWASNMGVANDNCCYCAGTGAPITYNPTSLRPTYSPTVSHAPTTSAAPTMCIGNTVNWVDVSGDGCDWYEANDLPGCPIHGSGWDGDMGVANDNCCYCAGTEAPATPVQWPTASPTATEVTSTY